MKNCKVTILLAALIATNNAQAMTRAERRAARAQAAVAVNTAPVAAVAARPLTGAERRAARRSGVAVAQVVPAQVATATTTTRRGSRVQATPVINTAPVAVVAARPLTGAERRAARRSGVAVAQVVPVAAVAARPLTSAERRAARVQANILSLDELSAADLVGINDVTTQGYGPLSDTIVFDNYKHYMQPDIRTLPDGTFELLGWHHDLGGNIERTKTINGHAIKITNKETHPSGLYRFEWSVGGANKKLSTFFPSTWSRQMVQQKIVEAYNYARNHNYIPQPQKNNTFALTGFTKEGIEIKIIVNQRGRVITAFPEWPKK